MVKLKPTNTFREGALVWVTISLLLILLISTIGFVYTSFRKQEKKIGELQETTGGLKKEKESDAAVEKTAPPSVTPAVNIQMGQEACTKADILLIEIKAACDIKPFPGIDECISGIESKLEYLGNEDYKKYHLDEKAKNLKELKSRYLEQKENCSR